MIRWVSHWSMCLFVIAFGCDVTVDPPAEDGDIDSGDSGGDGGPLRVMTWNLENFPTSANTVERVAGLIEELDVDLVGIQEIVSVEAFAELVGALPEHDGIFANDPGADMVVGLLFRDERVHIIEEATLFRDDWYAFPRPPLMARVEIVGPGGAVEMEATIVVVHLKAQLDDDSRERRLAGCERLEAWLANDISSGGADEAIVIGDFNDEITDSSEWNVFEPFLSRPDRYVFLTKELAETGSHTYLPFDSFLDHIMITIDTLDELGNGSAQVLELESTVPNYEYSVSDHRPVLAEFEVP